VPTLILGGGGYTIRNVARCWTFETAVVLGEEISNDLPYNDYYEYYGPDYKLHIPASTMENLNQPDNLTKLTAKIMEHMKQWQPVPNVQMHQPPPDMALEDEAEEDDPEERVSKAAADASVDHPAEFMDGRAGE
jgi:histone deacetylase 1/2